MAKDPEEVVIHVTVPGGETIVVKRKDQSAAPSRPAEGASQ